MTQILAMEDIVFRSLGSWFTTWELSSHVVLTLNLLLRFLYGVEEVRRKQKYKHRGLDSTWINKYSIYVFQNHLDHNNPYAKMFQSAREILECSPVASICLRTLPKEGCNWRQYNFPTMRWHWLLKVVLKLLGILAIWSCILLITSLNKFLVSIPAISLSVILSSSQMAPKAMMNTTHVKIRDVCLPHLLNVLDRCQQPVFAILQVKIRKSQA